MTTTMVFRLPTHYQLSFGHIRNFLFTSTKHFLRRPFLTVRRLFGCFINSTQGSELQSYIISKHMSIDTELFISGLENQPQYYHTILKESSDKKNENMDRDV